MSSEKKLELTTSDILNVLQHGATREDINDVRQEIIQVRSEVTQFRSDLNTKIDTVAKDLDNKINTVAKEFHSELKNTKKEMINTMKWGFGLAIVILGAIHFFH